MQDLLIFPFNGNGLEALSCLGEGFRFLGFVDDTPDKQGKHLQGFEVYDRSAFSRFPDAKVLAVPGSPTSFRTRHEIITGLKIEDARWATVIHPAASVSRLSSVGKNVLLMAGVVLTSNCTVGDHAVILPNTVIHHDSSVGRYTLVGSNVTVAGHSHLEENCYIGSGSSIINGIRIGRGTLVGMGSNVIRSLPENVKAAGNPAKVLPS